MTKDAEELMAKALKSVTVHGSFSPAELGAKIGLSKMEAEVAARSLSDAGILVLGFDLAATFSPDYRKAQARIEAREALKKKSAKPVRRSTRQKTPAAPQVA